MDKNKKRFVNIIFIIVILLLSGCGSFAKNTKPTADEKLGIAIQNQCKETKTG